MYSTGCDIARSNVLTARQAWESVCTVDSNPLMCAVLVQRERYILCQERTHISRRYRSYCLPHAAKVVVLPMLWHIWLQLEYEKLLGRGICNELSRDPVWLSRTRTQTPMLVFSLRTHLAKGKTASHLYSNVSQHLFQGNEATFSRRSCLAPSSFKHALEMEGRPQK